MPSPTATVVAPSLYHGRREDHQHRSLLGAKHNTPTHDVARDVVIAANIALHQSGLSSHSSLLPRRHAGSMISSSSLSSVIPPFSSSSRAHLVVVGTHGGLGGRSACRTPRRRWFGLGAGDSNTNNNSSSNQSGGNDGAPTSFLRRFLLGIAYGEDVGDCWSAYSDDSGRVYYCYAETGVTQWD